jgi:hypothetical protein
MAETNIPISDISLARLQELARWASISVHEALDQAIKEQYDRKFWEATNAGYAALRADPVVWAEIEQERRSLEGTLLDGLDADERWTEDGDVLTPAPRIAPDMSEAEPKA